MKRNQIAIISGVVFLLFVVSAYFAVKSAKPAHTASAESQDIVISLHKQTEPMKLKLVQSVSDIKSGECLVQFDECYFDKSATPKWEKTKCDMIAFSHSYQVVDVDQNVKKVLTLPWFGEGNDGFVDSSDDRQTLGFDAAYKVDAATP